MDFSGQHILSAKQFSQDDIFRVFREASAFLPYARKEQVSDILSGKVLAALFYEPSTRTRLSFETAMLRLGGSVVSVTGVENSSIKKGETLYDTAHVISQYADVVAMRHSTLGSVQEFSRGASIPVLNAGDGPGEHPTQALLDIFTLWQEHRGLDELRIAFVGDLKFSRTVHSLVYLLRYFPVKITIVAPKELRLPDEYVQILQAEKIPVAISHSLEEILGDIDVVYMTRVQKERFANKAEYERLKHIYVLRRTMLDSLKNQILVFHPLPRVGEITEDVDTYQGARYFQQVQNGVAVRMALLSLVLGKP